MKILSLIAGFISIVLSIHYFYSYRILTGLFKANHLDYMSIITFEDICYQLGNVNIMIMSIAGSGLIWIYLWHLVIIDEVELRKDTKNVISKVFRCLFKWITKKLKIRLKPSFKFIVLAGLFIICVLLILIYLNYFADDSINLTFVILLNFLIIPALYIFIKKKRELIFILYLFCMFLSGLFIIDSTYSQQNASANEKENRDKVEIVSFDYNLQHFETSSDTSLIYNGYKYLVLKTESKGIYDLIPKEEIKNMKKKVIIKNK